MMTVYIDITLKISTELTDKEKLMLTMTSKQMDELKYKFRYQTKIDVDKISGLSYFDNFECVEISDAESICPKFAKYVYFVADTINIPPFVTHLTFDDQLMN